MEGTMNAPPVLNGGDNVYDRAICFDAPVEFDSGEFAYERYTLAQVRNAIIKALGFLDPLTFLGTRTLAELRNDLKVRLGFAAIPINQLPPGMAELLDSFVNEAQQTIFRRLELDHEGATLPPRMVADADVTTIDYVQVFTLALGLAKAHYGHQDYKLYLEQSERYIGDVARRRPPMLTSTVTEYIKSAQELLYFRYDVLRNDRWWAWQTSAGRGIYDVPIDCTKFLDFRKITGAWISDNGGRALRPYMPSTAYAVDQYIAPTIPNGYEYRVTVAGTTTDDPEPNPWPLTPFTNGTVTMTPVAAASTRMLPLRQNINPSWFNQPGHAMPTNFEVDRYLHVWPVPDKTYVIWLRGHLGLRSFTADTDVLTIDYQPVFLHALAACKEQFKQMGAATHRRDLEILLGGYTAASHGAKKYVPNPRPMKASELWFDECTPPLPRATWR
jgi:hypothetical protein